MHYREIPPAPHLRPWVECLWSLEAEADPASAAFERIFPDGCVELIVHVGDPVSERRDEGPGVAEQPTALVVGQLRRPMQIRPHGKMDVVAVRFRPAGASAFLRGDLDDLTGATVALTDLWGGAAAHLAEQLRECAPQQRLRRLEGWLEGRFHGSADPIATEGVRVLLASAGQMRIARVAERVGLGRRQLERRFRRVVGLTPKELASILRFQGLLRRLDRDAAGWAGLALDCGYADQAHLTREFTRLAGSSPAAWLARRPDLAEPFVAPERLDALFSPA